MDQTISDRIERLTPALRRKANFFATQTPEYEGDELFSEMVIALATKAEQDPEFLNRSDAMLITYAKWVGGHNMVRRTAKYNQYVGNESDFLRFQPTHDEEDEEFQAIEMYATEDTSIEEQVIQLEVAAELHAAIARLSPKNQTVVKLLYVGYSESEIAAQLKVSPPAITYRKQTIARMLSEMVPGLKPSQLAFASL